MKPLAPFKRSSNPGSPYYVSFMVDRRAYQWSTKTDDLALAKKRAKVYRDAIVEKAFSLVSAMKQGGDAPTIGDLIAAYEQLPSPNKATRTRNIGAMRIVMAPSGLTDRDRVTKLDGAVIERFQNHCLKERPGDMSAVVTCNSKVRCARSLLAKRALQYYYNTPNRVPAEVVREFFRIAMLKEPEQRPVLPTEAADAKAHTDLPAAPRAYRCFLLGRYAGLRAGEIKAARRDWLEGTKLYVGGKEFVAKSRKWRVVDLPQQVVDVLLLSDDPVYLAGVDRVEFVDRTMPGILRDMGFPADKPLHSLRKLAGSLVYNTAGPRQARDFLGHSAQATTDRFYARSLEAPKALGWAG